MKKSERKIYKNMSGKSVNNIDTRTAQIIRKKLFLKVSQYSQEKHLCWSLYLTKLQAWSFQLYQKDSNTGFLL